MEATGSNDLINSAEGVCKDMYKYDKLKCVPNRHG